MLGGRGRRAGLAGRLVAAGGSRPPRVRWSRPTSASDLDDLGRRLAERWGCDPLVVDAAWLHADRGGVAESRRRVARPTGDHPGGVPNGPSRPPGRLRRPGREMPPSRAPAADPDGRGAGALRRPVRRPDRHAARGAGDAAERPSATAGRPPAPEPGTAPIASSSSWPSRPRASRPRNGRTAPP